MVITGQTNLKEALDTYPQLTEVLISLSPKFKKLRQTHFLETVSRWATVGDVARMGDLSLCQVLHVLNQAIGQEDALVEAFPDCIKESLETKAATRARKFSRVILFDTREREDYFLPELIRQIEQLRPGEALELVSDFEPLPFRNMVETMAYDYFVVAPAPGIFETYVFPRPDEKPRPRAASEKIPLVLQSATPIAYPVLLRLLDSEAIQAQFEIVESKVWRETEKHLAWIVNGKADISFSAVMSSAKLFRKGVDIRMPVILVWDNFKILTRGYEARRFEDLRGHKIHTPLFKNAPPAIVTRYMMQRFGSNPDEFEFVFGDPFGRPDEIKECFVAGDCDTVILREPEASFALYEAGSEAHISIDYGALWSELHPGSGKLPNAGLLFKGSYVDAHPEAANLFITETRKALAWVQAHPQEAAVRSAEAMGKPAEEIEFFIRRATLHFEMAANVKTELETYLTVVGGSKVKPAAIQKSLAMFD